MRPYLLPALLLALAGPAAAQHHDHASTPSVVAAAPAHRFAADATLRADMAAIRSRVEGLDHYRHGHVPPDGARRLAADVQARVRDIVAHCTLPPDADAACMA